MKTNMRMAHESSRIPPIRREDQIDDVMARVAAKLRQIRGPLHPADLDALVNDIVLDVARFALQWTDGIEADR